ncbi:hypothetical protein GCM10023201_47650 [Actinomycetospora corticicola]|uniref:Serine/threonine-protein kinase n=1 Tax=Actinomycetospora corticicola TaxID=663602 RepID=A0A7Y9E1X2_9PSEU|nr:hypothetical protein [Actinomycetospora corticicola]NYD39525.1 serine/threonine-protein kinase [Actinomycetospora corticicola]
MTADESVQETGSTRDGDDGPEPDTEGVQLDTGRAEETDPDTEVLVGGAADAAVRGVDEVLGREVRLVTLPPATGDALSDRIEQVRHLARLHHPHLLEVYDVDGLAPDTESTLVLESVAGEPLPLVLRDGPVPAADLARMGAQLASALAHAHAHHVEHGAIGPASILVNRAGAEAWLVGLTASLSGPLPVLDAADGADGAAARRAADVRALARTLAEVAGHTGDPDAEGLVALLRAADTDLPPSAAALSERLIRLGRDDTPDTDDAVAARLVPVVASWAESPVAAGDTGPTAGAAVAVGPAVHAHGAGGTPVVVIPGQRARRAGVLAAATATLALASGLVIWAGESQVVRSIPQAEVGTSAAAPVGLPVLPALVPALPASADDSSGSADTSDGDTGGTWTRTAESSSATPSPERAPEVPPTGGTTPPAPTTDSTQPTGPTGPTGPPGGTTPPGDTTPPGGTTPPSTTAPPPTTTVPGTTMPGTPTTVPPTTTVPGSTPPPATTTVPGTTGAPVDPSAPAAPTTTTTTPVPVPGQAGAMLAFGLH